MSIARRIMAEAARYGIAKRDLVMDALTMNRIRPGNATPW